MDEPKSELTMEEAVQARREQSIMENRIVAKTSRQFGETLAKSMMHAQSQSEGLMHEAKGAMKVHAALSEKIHIFIDKKVDDGEWTEDQRSSAFEILRLCLGSAQSVAVTCETHHDIKKGEALGYKKAAEVASKLESGSIARIEVLESAGPDEDVRFGGRAKSVEDFRSRRAERIRQASVEKAEVDLDSEPGEDQEVAVPKPTPPEKMTAQQLKAKLRRANVKFPVNAKKPDLVKLFKEHLDERVQDS